MFFISISPRFRGMPFPWRSWGPRRQRGRAARWREWQHHGRIEVLGNLLLFRLTSSTLSHHAMAEIGKCTVPRRWHCFTVRCLPRQEIVVLMNLSAATAAAHIGRKLSKMFPEMIRYHVFKAKSLLEATPKSTKQPSSMHFRHGTSHLRLHIYFR